MQAIFGRHTRARAWLGAVLCLLPLGAAAQLTDITQTTPQVSGGAIGKSMTAPLWGVGTKAPYGHDGRSVTLEEAILRHGGEAEASKNAFAALDEDNRRKIIEFLQTLVLFPPDDTASNLNPGNPATTNPQDPSQHGSIALSALFQIPSEGGE